MSIVATTSSDGPSGSNEFQPGTKFPSTTSSSPLTPHHGAANNEESEPPQTQRADGKVEIKEEDYYEKLGFSFPTWKKWLILCVIFLVQVSMNFNTSIYANGLVGMAEEFDLSLQTARIGQMIFLVAYGFGSELWAPWSEEIGRWPVMQASLFLVNIWQIPCALAPNFATIVIGRFLGGISSAGGSVTLGMIADMWEVDDGQYAVAFIVFSSVGGSVVGPIVGGFAETYLHWRWVFWLSLVFGAAVQAVHFFVPETRATCMLDRIAQKRRKVGIEENVWGPNELKGKRFDMREILRVWARPFVMFVREPIVFCLSLLSGFSDALIFTFFECFGIVWKQWGFSKIAIGLSFIPILISYIISYLSYIPWIRREQRIRRVNSDAPPEIKLTWLLFLAPLEVIGLFGFAWTSLGPSHNIPWIVPMIFSGCIAIANYAIYQGTIDYMVAAYGPYSASATGGNALARDFLAGISAMYAIPLYQNVGGKLSLEWASTLLGFIAMVVISPLYVFYYYGPQIRERSRFAQTLEHERKVRGGHGALAEKDNSPYEAPQHQELA
ncbi:MAG: hypothetical protein M1834_002491 [Cirrosporium novae-zelandiae]|nr:MAG: hypothetical protein M1834_002491 [Cirrosporium novae-zelandiae]